MLLVFGNISAVLCGCFGVVDALYVSSTIGRWRKHFSTYTSVYADPHVYIYIYIYRKHDRYKFLIQNNKR